MTPVPTVVGASELTAEQEGLARSVAGLCQGRSTAIAAGAAAAGFVDELWRPLAELGVLGLGTPEGGGGAREIAVAMSVLGAAAFPGPLAAAVLAVHVLDEPLSDQVAAGSTMPALVVGDLVPLPADIFLGWGQDGIRRLEPDRGRFDDGDRAGRLRTVDGTPAVRASGWITTPLADRQHPAIAMADVAIAAFLCGATAALVGAAAAYAGDRRQFGKAIGEFQAVAFPLADAYVRLTAASELTWSAAATIDGQADADLPASAAATAHASARRAALQAVHTCHQVYGAIGYTEEGPMALLRRRVAAWALLGSH